MIIIKSLKIISNLIIFKIQYDLIKFFSNLISIFRNLHILIQALVREIYVFLLFWNLSLIKLQILQRYKI